MSLHDVTRDMLRQRATAEEAMCRGFCETFRCAPQDCHLELREMRDGTTEYWIAFGGQTPIMVGRAYPLETVNDGDTILVRQRFEVLRFPKTGAA